MRSNSTRNPLQLPCSVCGVLVARRVRSLECKQVLCSSHRYPNPVERFWERVQKSEGCWLWTGYIASTGYGQFSVKSKPTEAHRFSWELHHGPITDGRWGLHKCDNRACVNPAHLFLGTLQDNYRDMLGKGKHPSKGGTWKLKPEQVTVIKRRLREGAVISELAQEFGVSALTVQLIRKGKRWASVE